MTIKVFKEILSCLEKPLIIALYIPLPVIAQIFKITLLFFNTYFAVSCGK